MKIFVAGATGVIGRRLVPLLVTNGLEVTAVSRSENKSRALRQQGTQPVRVDIFEASAVERAVKGHDVVINMATHIPPSSRVRCAFSDARRRNSKDAATDCDKTFRIGWRNAGPLSQVVE